MNQHPVTTRTADPATRYGALAMADRPTRIGVLIANLGTPDGHDYWAVRRYLSEFLSDRRVIDYPVWKWQPILQGIVLSKRPFSSGAAYRQIWNNEKNESPLLTITREQSDRLGAALAERHGDRLVTDFCMRYGNPTTSSVTARLVAQGCDRILFFPLYPQYCSATTGTANDQFFRALMAEKLPPACRTVLPYYDRPDYIEVLAASIERRLEGRVPEKLVVSYHGLPERYIRAGEPYYHDCLGTSRLLAARLGWPEGVIDTTFQSVFGREEWVRPYTVEHVAELARAGVRDLAIVAPAFVADCIETLEEINGEIRHAYEGAGGTGFTYVPCLNASDAHIELLTRIVEENLQGWL